jgi:heptosyltransferase-2
VLERLIVRLPNWLGDTVMAVPALRAVRTGMPEARLLAAGPWASMLAGQGLADVLVDYPRSWKGRLRTADAVRAFDAEAAVVLPNSLEAALAALYWAARRRIGFAANGRSVLLTDRLPLPSPRRHQVDEYLMLAERLGVAVTDREPRLTPPAPEAATRVHARALLDAVGVPPAGGAPRIGVHLGAAYGSSKVWPADRVASLCARVARDGGVPVLLGAPGDVGLADAVRRTAEAPSLVGRDRPEILPALLSELDVLVSGDTGVAHLAAALGTPVVTLFGPTDPELSAPRGRAIVVRHPVPCAPCFYRTCPIEHPCMRGIGGDDVAAVAWLLLEKRA